MACRRNRKHPGNRQSGSSNKFSFSNNKPNARWSLSDRKRPDLHRFRRLGKQICKRILHSSKHRKCQQHKNNPHFNCRLHLRHPGRPFKQPAQNLAGLHRISRTAFRQHYTAFKRTERRHQGRSRQQYHLCKIYNLC